MKNLLTFNYWFNLQPEPFLPLPWNIFIGTVACFFAAAIGLAVIKMRPGLYRGFFKRLAPLGKGEPGDTQRADKNHVGKAGEHVDQARSQQHHRHIDAGLRAIGVGNDRIGIQFTPNIQFRAVQKDHHA